MRTEMTSKERISAALGHEPVDHLPLCFEGLCHGWVQFVNDQYPDPFARASYYLGLGVDTALGIGIEWKPDASVSVTEWTEERSGEILLHKQYDTKKGKLTQTVRKNKEYPHCSIPLMDDYNVPSGRSARYLVEGEEQLEALECLLNSLERSVSDGFYEYAKKAKEFCKKNGIMLSGYLQGVGDPLMWLSGVENILFAAMDAPFFLHRYIGILSARDRRHLEILLDAGVDMVLRRGWYESADFWSPKLYREFLAGPLSREIQLAREAGVKYTYIMNSGITALAGELSGLRPDLLFNIEPEKNDIARIRRELGGRVALCGGVNNYNVVERGTEEDVRNAVHAALQPYPASGFILAPSDSILDTSENAVQNFHAMIAAWKEMA